MLNLAQTAVMLGLAEHDIPVLIRAGLLKPLGHPPANVVKSFGTAQVLELAAESAMLNKIRRRLYEYWRGKNAGKARVGRSHTGFIRQVKITTGEQPAASV